MVDVKLELNEIEAEVVIPALLPNPGISLRSVDQEEKVPKSLTNRHFERMNCLLAMLLRMLWG